MAVAMMVATRARVEESAATVAVVPEVVEVVVLDEEVMVTVAQEGAAERWGATARADKAGSPSRPLQCGCRWKSPTPAT